jgi:hypothetical protein
VRNWCVCNDSCGRVTRMLSGPACAVEEHCASKSAEHYSALADPIALQRRKPDMARFCADW